MAIRSYSPQDVNVMLGGFYAIDGFVDGTFINITKDVQPYGTKRTADGTVARIHRKDETYTIELTLASTAPANDILTKLYQVDAATEYGKFPLFVKDTLGTSLFLATLAWIKEIPSLSFSNGVENRVWTMQAYGGSFSVGGNESSAGLVQDFINTVTGSGE